MGSGGNAGDPAGIGCSGGGEGPDSGGRQLYDHTSGG